MDQSQNLQVYLQQDRLIQEVSSGMLAMEFIVNNGVIRGVSVFGSKKLLYNRSDKDQKTNEVAARDIIQRILDAVNRGEREEIEFKVKVASQKVQSVEWHSKQNKTFDASAR